MPTQLGPKSEGSLLHPPEPIGAKFMAPLCTSFAGRVQLYSSQSDSFGCVRVGWLGPKSEGSLLYRPQPMAKQDFFPTFRAQMGNFCEVHDVRCTRGLQQGAVRVRQQPAKHTNWKCRNVMPCIMCKSSTLSKLGQTVIVQRRCCTPLLRVYRPRYYGVRSASAQQL